MLRRGVSRDFTNFRLGMNRLITAKADPQTSRAHWTMGRGESSRAFHSARRHSRVVRVLRIAVPAAVALGVVAIVLITYFNPLRMLAKLPLMSATWSCPAPRSPWR